MVPKRIMLNIFMVNSHMQHTKLLRYQHRNFHFKNLDDNGLRTYFSVFILFNLNTSDYEREPLHITKLYSLIVCSCNINLLINRQLVLKNQIRMG